MGKIKFWFGGVFLLFLLFVVVEGYLEYKSTIQSTKAQTYSLTLLLEKKIQRDFDQTKGALDFVQSVFRILPDQHKNFDVVDKDEKQKILSQRLTLLVKSFEGLDQIIFMNAKGDVIFGSKEIDESVNIADRPHFQILKNNPDKKYSVSNIITARTTGKKSIALLKAIRHEDGTFLGAISALMPLERIDDIISSVDVGQKGVTLLRNADTSVLISRFPEYNKDDFNQPLPPTNPIFSKILEGQKSGELVYRATIDGVERLGSFKVLDDYPFYVQVAFAQDDYLAAWKNQALIVSFLLLVLGAGLFFVARSFIKSFKKEQEALSRLSFERKRISNLNSRTNAVLNAQSDIVIVTEGSKIVEANRAFLEFTGFDSLDGFKQKYDCICDMFVEEPFYIAKEVNGKPWSDYLLQYPKETNLAKIIKEDREYVFKLSVKKLPEASEVVITMSDITKETLRERQIQNFAIHLPGTIYQYQLNTDGNSCFPFVSDNIYDIVEYTPQELLLDGSKAFRAIDSDDVQRVREEVDISAKTLQNWKSEFVVNHSKKGKRWIKGLAKPQRLENGSTMWHGYLEDITAMRDKDEEIKRAKERLEKLNAHLQEEVAKQVELITDKDKLLQEQTKLAQMGEMIGAIAHQWRQPLNALNINIQNLDDYYEDGLIDKMFIDDFIERQLDTIDFMSKTIDDFRNFFKSDKEKTLFSIKDVVLNVKSLLSEQLKGHSIALEIEGDDFSIQGYMSEMKQVFLNIVSNSKDAIIENSKSGYIKIYLDAESKTVTVKDSGGGAPQEVVDRLFDPYYTTKGPDKGTGIGLHMSRTMVVKHMHGQMKAYNCDEGLCIEIRFS